MRGPEGVSQHIPGRWDNFLDVNDIWMQLCKRLHNCRCSFKCVVLIQPIDVPRNERNVFRPGSLLLPVSAAIVLLLTSWGGGGGGGTSTDLF